MKNRMELRYFEALHNLISRQTGILDSIQRSQEQLLDSFLVSRINCSRIDDKAAEKIKIITTESHNLGIRKIALKHQSTEIHKRIRSRLGHWYERFIAWLKEPVSWGGREIEIEITPHYARKIIHEKDETDTAANYRKRFSKAA